MIVCQCNAISDRAVLAALDRTIDAPTSPAQIYRCMGCSPDCGRCAPALRQLLREAKAGGCAMGCPGCPSQAFAETANDDEAQNAVARRAAAR